MSYTKGPWHWNMNESHTTGMPELLSADGTSICDFGDSEQYYPSQGIEPSAPDRALIAAAPELLEALEACAHFADNAGIVNGVNVLAAIAKARGSL